MSVALEVSCWIIATAGVYVAYLWVYQVAMALLGHTLGAKVERVSLGIDIFGYGWRWQGRWWEWTLGIVPLGGYTKFVGSDESYDEENATPKDDVIIDDYGRALPPGSILSVPPLSRACICLLGPLATLAVAVILLLIPARLGSHQLQLTSPSEGAIRPAAVSGLSPAGNVATVQGQFALTGHLGWETFCRIFFLKPRGEWGGLVAYFVMCVAAGLFNTAVWLTCVGIFGVCLAAVNLVPLPTTCGGQAMQYFAEAFGFVLPERIQIRAALVSLLFTLAVFARFFWFDLLWVWNLVAA